MSLQATANLLQNQGRGDDKMLVHMTPREVAGLEAIARAKGGQLTINPQTGLPEAGFLDDILPVAATGALMFFGGPAGMAIGEGLGLSGALAQGVGMGLLAGGATTLLTGDINKGLKTGLTAGALSGAMAGLSGPSTAEVPTANVETATPALEAAKTAPSVAQSPNAFAYNAAGEMVPANYPAQVTGATNLPPAPTSTAEKSWWGSLSPKAQLATGLAGAAGLSLLGGMKQDGVSLPTDKGTIRPYEYQVSKTQPTPYFQPVQYGLDGRTTTPMDTSERTYFTQGYKALPTYAAAEGGMVPQLQNMPNGGLSAIEGMRDGYGATQTVDGNIPQYAAGGPIAFRKGGEAEDDDIQDLAKQLRKLQSVNVQIEPQLKDLADQKLRMRQMSGEEPMMPDRFVPQMLAASQPDMTRGIGQTYPGMVEGSQMMDRNKLMGVRDLPQKVRSQVPNPIPDVGISPQSLDPKNLAGIVGINKQLDDDTRLKLMAAGHSNKYDKGFDRVGAGLTRQLDKDSDISAFYERTPGTRDQMGGVRYNKRFALGGTASATATAPESSGPKYTFDPATQQYTQTYNPIQAIQQGGNAIGMGLISRLVNQGAFDAQGGLPKYSFDPKLQAYKALAGGGQLGAYSDGGRMLKGPGDGMSDSIPGTINDKQPARLADGEFVVPADVVSHLGNGSTDAGAKRLYDMMDRVRKARTGTKKQGKQIKAEKYLPK